MADRAGRGTGARPLEGTRAHGALAAGGVAAAAAALAFARRFPGWFDGGLSGVILFAATAVLVLGGVLLLRVWTAPGRLVDATATICVGALIADGLTLGFMPGLFAATEDVMRHAGAWRLFGGGAALAFAVLFERRPVA